MFCISVDATHRCRELAEKSRFSSRLRLLSAKNKQTIESRHHRGTLNRDAAKTSKIANNLLDRSVSEIGTRSATNIAC
jgi:hypothetical protein